MNVEKDSRDNEQPVNDQENNMNKEDSSRPIWVIILAMLGIFAVITALGIGIFQIAGRTSDNFSEIRSNLGGLFQREERLSLSTESMTIASDEVINITVQHQNKKTDTGSYTIEFGCVEGVTAELEGEPISCGESADLVTIDSDIRLTLSSTADRYKDVPVKVSFLSEDKELQSDLLFTVVNRKIASESPTADSDTVDDEKSNEEKEPEATQSTEDTNDKEGNISKPEPTRPKTPKVVERVEPSDIKVTIDEIGYIDPSSREFVRSSRVKTTDRAAIKLTISNIGKSETGNWYFTALVPTKNDRYRNSGKQISLKPGQKMGVTLSFDDIDPRGDQTFYFNADPRNEVKEVTKRNNTAQIKFNVLR